MLVQKAGLADAVGLIEGLYPGAAAAGLRTSRKHDVEAPRIAEVYTRGTLTLARLGREAPIADGNPAGPALRDVEGGSLAAALYADVRHTHPATLPRSPVIGTDAPVQYEQRDDIGAPRKRLRRSWQQLTRGAPRLDVHRTALLSERSPLQTPAAFEYERATSVDGAIASLAAARLGGAGHRRRPQPAADDEAAPGEPRAPDRHQRPHELAYIREQGDEIRIGALTRHVDLLQSELLAEHFPLFRDAEKVIADPVVRNRGTIGGSLCQASSRASAACAPPRRRS